MLRVMEQRFRHFVEGFLSAFNLFPALPPIEVRLDRRSSEEAMRDDWIKVGGDIRAALEEARDETRAAEGHSPGSW